ncbi:MAG: replicative DNA helicase [Chloroflexota bacterium]|nr:replicative DNA helicase [Chloroflexota bacterium]
MLGAILLSERSIAGVVIEEGLRAEDFYRSRHGVVFEAMLALFGEGEPIDVLTVDEHLRAHGRLEEGGGEGAVDALTGGVPVAGNAKRYARIVKELALLRRLRTAALEIGASVDERDGGPRDIIERAERRILDVAHDDRQKDFRSIEDVLFTELEKLERLSREGTSLTGTPSGFKLLDDITGGFQPGNLIIIAARPSMGKSTLVTNMAENVALDHGRPVALFSLEMSEAELAQRFVASQSDVHGDHLRKGRVAGNKWPRVRDAAKRLAAAPMWIDDSSDVGLLEVRAKARRLHQQHELGLIIVDYLQLLRPDRTQESRVLQIGEMSRGLKILAGELQVPVVALSQLSRAVEARTDKHPLLSDLRESGCLTGDTLVHLAGTGGRLPIRELVDRDDIEVLALDPRTWMLEPRRMRSAFCTGTKPVFRLRLASGRTVRATGNHRFLTIEGWRRLDELDKETHLATPRDLPTLVRPAMAATGTTPRQVEAAIGIQRRAPSTLYRSGIGRERAQRLALMSRCEPLRHLAASDVYWDRVRSIEPDGVAEVFDLEVDGLHNFVAGDIVAHNSLEQDADLVMFIYRDEYYDPESERQGEADLIIAKHRSGGLGTVPLVFQKDFPRFRTMLNDPERYT